MQKTNIHVDHVVPVRIGQKLDPELKTVTDPYVIEVATGIFKFVGFLAPHATLIARKGDLKG
jgi:hypothetical protein